MSRRFTLITALLVAVAVGLGTGPAFCQVAVDPVGDNAFVPEALPQEPDGFGIGFQSYVIPAADFVPQTTLEYTYSGAGYISRSAGPGTTWWAPITLPAGSNVQMMVALVYDTDGPSDITAQWGAYTLHQSSSPGPGFTEFSNASSSGTGGYTYIWFAGPTMIRYYYDLNSDGTNDWVAYRVSITLPATGTAMRFAGVVVSWNRTISAAPASATFVDVPVGAFGFRHIEALVASGITGGCDATHFCPNSSVTRAQMAVFLAKALGLHYED
ncbi:MAG: S-layer homology domain-containing protein [Acidobacteria bacterium]|nr:S-layer homology domain-containing protein [Acidobacteriota bacterium]